MRTFIINLKNYSAVQGEGALRLARTAARISRVAKAEIIVAPPTPLLGLVAAKVGIPVFAQSVSADEGDKTTGAVLPEAIAAAGAAGTILNHSENRIARRDIRLLVPRLKKLRIRTCLCAQDDREVAYLARFQTEYLAVEPPELIGSGVAVSKAKPALVRRSVGAARDSGYRGRVLCGAGIVDGEDVSKAVELGADGILVASSIVNARNWGDKIRELSLSLD